MKILGRLILVLIIVIPIILCVATLNKVWSEDTEADTENELLNQDFGKVSGEQIIFDNGVLTDESGEISGEKETSELGTQTSKLIDATVSVSVANVYAEPNENSKIVGTFEKHAEILAQKHSNGWARVTNNTTSGWMRLENITFPEGTTSLVTDRTKTGKIKAEPYLNVRASANATADVITTIPNGTEIEIKEEVNGWYKVTYASATGWVSAAYVEVK